MLYSTAISGSEYMDRLVALGELVDWYGGFLTPRQTELVRQYVDEDCSLSEIAEREGISRQAVRDAIARAEQELGGMERRLRLIERVGRMRALASEAAKLTDDPALLQKLDELTGLWEDEDGV